MSQKPSTPLAAPPKRMTRTQFQRFVLLAVGGAPLAWDIGFNLGAFQNISYERTFFVIAAAIGLVLALLVIGGQGQELFELQRRDTLLLPIPLIWLITTLSLSAVVGRGHWVLVLVQIVGTLIVFFFWLPYAATILFRILQPDAKRLSNLQRKQLVAIIVFVGVLGWLVGHNHFLFLSCEEFQASGYDAPANCVPLESFGD